MVDEAKAEGHVLRQNLMENVGMTQYEAKVYLALIRGGKQSMTGISEVSGVPTQRVYDTVRDLQNRGFVEVIDEYPKKAYAIDPDKALASAKKQIERTQDRLNELHQVVEDVDVGVTLFQSRATIEKHVQETIREAEDSLFLLMPENVVSMFRDGLLDCDTDTDTHLIVSDIEFDDIDNESLAIDESITELADRVRGVTSSEPVVVSADRKTSFYWTGIGGTRLTTEGQGFYVTNPELTLVLDRFLSDTLWPLARTVGTTTESEMPQFPKQYLRIRNCLADLDCVTRERPVESFVVEFDGYNTETGDEVTEHGTLVGYYFSEYERRASLKLRLDTETAEGIDESEIVTVGGWKAIKQDFSARHIRIRKKSFDDSHAIDPETDQHLSTLRDELPSAFSNENVFVGLDAFIDRKREIMTEAGSGSGSDVMTEFGSFKESIIEFEAVDSAPAIQWNHSETIPGGHTTHLGTVFTDLSYDVTLLGTFGDPVHPIFEKRFDEQTLLSIGIPSYTDYISFDDGQFMLTEPQYKKIDWNTILKQIDLEDLAGHIDGVEMISLGTWSNNSALPSICDGLRDELWPLLDDPPQSVVVSPSSLEEVPADEIRSGFESIAALDRLVPVTVVLNRVHARQLLDAYDGDDFNDSLKELCLDIRDRIAISKVVVHTMFEATLANDSDVLSARAPKPDSRQVTSTIEHFDTGLTLGHIEGLSDGAALVLAHTTAGYFMRHSEHPDRSDIFDFVSNYEDMF